MTSLSLRAAQKQALLQSNYYRQGRWDEHQEKSRAQRVAEILATQVPAEQGGVNAWPGLDEDDFSLDGREPDGSGTYEAMEELDDDRDDAKAQARKAAKLLPRSFKFVKLLGWGGEGAAALFRWYDRKGNLGKEYVAKFKMPDGDKTPHDEVERMKVFRGAKHILQSYDIKVLNRKSREMMVFLEYCPHGSLEGVLRRIAARWNGVMDTRWTGVRKRWKKKPVREPVRDRTLWLIFDCLFRMVVALRYPPKYWQPGLDLDDLNLPQVWERIPTARDAAWRPASARAARTRGQKAARNAFQEAYLEGRNPNWVHFDIDPSNILVESREQVRTSPHYLVPGMKLSDFSRCTDINAISRDPMAMWNSRYFGKAGWLTPEQFTAEWNWVDILPDGAKVAGQYGWKTNLWSMGMVMWCLMTHCAPPDGPYPGEYGDPGALAWTYGAFLLREDKPQFANIDPDLRNLVVECLMDRPADRPEMDTIEKAIAKNLKRRRWPRGGTEVNSDLDIQQGAQSEAIFVSPPLSNHPDNHLAQWLAGTLDIIGD
ncbi:kinase-like domain-containing protein [Lasiosphaeria hispida]|uniref:non-specific serine/threonine protein kinase n=1 Tax=Lasiosphaeria hispida TaxID=260671 RepID=A0AAJ0HB85_9PEZI|nr:kinase-like domain-containing protein [Lasiosphaeria hispida]